MLASPIFASTTYAANGTCALNGRRASGTYGYVTEGVATGPNPFVPPGLFPQAGTIALTAQQEDASTLTGTWSVSLAQNDASGPRGAGDKVRTIALTPNLIVSRSTAKKLWAAAAD